MILVVVFITLVGILVVGNYLFSTYRYTDSQHGIRRTKSRWSRWSRRLRK